MKTFSVSFSICNVYFPKSWEFYLSQTDNFANSVNFAGFQFCRDVTIYFSFQTIKIIRHNVVSFRYHLLAQL